jgi:hypothetical protein
VNLAKAGAGGRDQVALFAALGVKVTDTSGRVRDSGEVMSELATKFAGLKDGASKSALAIEVFGKTGAQLIPFLNEGGAGLAKLGAEADRFGITISAGAAKSSQEFNDNLSRLEIAASRVGTRVAAELSPALANLTAQLLGSKDGADALKSAGEVLANVLRVLVSAGVIASSIFDAVGTSIGRAGSAIVSAAHGDFSEVINLSNGFQADMLASASRGLDRLKAVWSSDTGVSDALNKQAEAGKRSADAMMRSLEEGKKAALEYDASLKALTKVALDYESKIAGFGAGPLEQLEAKLDKGELGEHLKKIGAAAEGMRDRILSAADALQQLEMNKLSLKVDFDVERSKAATGRDVEKRTRDFGNIGKPPEASRTLAEGGFASFDAAMTAYAKQMDVHARRIGEAELLRASGDEEGAKNAIRFADAAQAAAEKANLAADAFAASVTAAAAFKAWQEHTPMGGVAASLANTLGLAGEAASGFAEVLVESAHRVLSKMGAVGEIANNAMSAFAKGGIWGAFASVIADVLVRLTGFQKMVDSMNAFFGRWISKVSEATAPLFDGIIQFCEDIGTLIETITDVTHSFEMIGIILRTVALILDTVELSFLYVGKGLLNMFGSHDDKLDAMIGKLERDVKRGYDPVQKAADDTAKSLQALNEQLINIPQGFKVAAARYGADNGGGGGGAQGPGGSSHSSDGGSTIYGPTTYGSTSTTTGTTGNVSQDQTSASTRPPPPTTPADYGSSLGSLSAAEQATWFAAFNSALVEGQSLAASAARGDAAVLAQRARGSGSGAATAAGGGVNRVGGPSGVTNIGSGAGAGGAEPITLSGTFNFYGVQDVKDLYEKITELANTKRALRTRTAF